MGAGRKLVQWLRMEDSIFVSYLKVDPGVENVE